MKRALAISLVICFVLLLSAGSSQATWISVYSFVQGGEDYDVVVTLDSDNLNNLYLDGYDGLEMSAYSSISDVLLLGNQAMTGNIQTSLVIAAMGSQWTNPGSVRMVYLLNQATDIADYRYLHDGFLSGVVEDYAFDYNAPVGNTLGYVVNSGTLVPEPSTALLLGLGLMGLRLTQRRR